MLKYRGYTEYPVLCATLVFVNESLGLNLKDVLDLCVNFILAINKGHKKTGEMLTSWGITCLLRAPDTHISLLPL